MTHLANQGGPNTVDNSGPLESDREFVTSNFNICIFLKIIYTFYSVLHVIFTTFTRNLSVDEIGERYWAISITAWTTPWLWNHTTPGPYTCTQFPRIVCLSRRHIVTFWLLRLINTLTYLLNEFLVDKYLWQFYKCHVQTKMFADARYWCSNSDCMSQSVMLRGVYSDTTRTRRRVELSW